MIARDLFSLSAKEILEYFSDQEFNKAELTRYGKLYKSNKEENIFNLYPYAKIIGQKLFKIPSILLYSSPKHLRIIYRDKEIVIYFNSQYLPDFIKILNHDGETLDEITC